MTPFAKRTAVYKRLAYQLKMKYSESDDWGMMGLLEDFKLFRHGRKKQISQVLFGQDMWQETKLHIFDYQYKASKDKIKRQTVFFINCKHLILPQFLMQPETIFHKFKNLLGFEDINFIEHPKFSNQYHLTGDDREWIEDAFTEKLIRFFTVEKDWSMEGVGYYLIFYKKNRLLSQRSILDLHKKGLLIAEMLESKPLEEI